MSYSEVARKLNSLVGADTSVTFDNDVEPKELRFYRPDALSTELVCEALARASASFPDEMAAITTIFVSFDDTYGITRRRIVV